MAVAREVAGIGPHAGTGLADYDELMREYDAIEAEIERLTVALARVRGDL